MFTYRSHIRGQMAWLAAMDIACLVAGCAIGSLARFAPEEWAEYAVNHIDGWLILVAGVLVANYLAGGYRLQAVYSRFNLIVTWLFSLLFATILLSVTSYGWFRLILGRGVLACSLLFYSVCSLLLKLFVYRTLFRSSWFVCRCAILGAGERANEIREVLESPWIMPAHRVVSYLVRADDAGSSGDASDKTRQGAPVLKFRDSEFEDLVRELRLDLLVIADDEPTKTVPILSLLRRVRFEGVEVLTESAAIEVYCGRTPIEMINDVYLTELAFISGGPAVMQRKRLFDIVTALAMLLLLAPVFVIIAVAIKLTDPRTPVFYTQERVGRFGKVFRIHKFRTMRQDAEQGTGPVWAGPDDPRITRVGRFLRRFRLDEIPQFVNILRGEMSFVGPRPERPEIAAEMDRKIPFFSERENVLPGLTGWAQIRYPYARTEKDSMRKLEYDLYYIKHMSFALDLQIILSTLRIVVLGMPSESV